MTIKAMLRSGLLASTLLAAAVHAAPRIGEPAPAFTAVDSNGRTVKLSDFAGKTVVISHHAPHRLSVHRKYVGHPLTPAFASDLSDLMHRTDLWIHGHAHDSFDYWAGRCRVVSNPAGYSLNRRGNLSGRESLHLENVGYQASYLVEI